MNKKGLVRFKFEYENVPILDVKKNIKDEKEFDNMIGGLKLKFFGK